MSKVSKQYQWFQFHRAKRDHIVWKKLQEHVAKCLLPKGTLFFVGGTLRYPKCRAEALMVLKIWRASRTPLSGFHLEQYKRLKKYEVYYPVKGLFFPKYEYTAGKVARPRRKFSMENITCASGIHFFFDYNHAKVF